MSRNDGGPAFPHTLQSEEFDRLIYSDGMKLRDWFAGQALIGLLSNNEAILCHLKQGLTAAGIMDTSRVLAAAAGLIADAMLAERDKPSTKEATNDEPPA